MQTRRKTLTFISSLLLALAAGASQAQPSFTLVRVQTEVFSPDEGLVLKQRFGDSFASVGEEGSLYAKGRAGLGNSGAYAFSADDREAFAETWWADAFTVTGGTGQGVLTIAISVSGTLSGNGRANYGLFARQQPFNKDRLREWLDCGGGNVCIPTAPEGSLALIPLTASFASGTTVLAATLPFTYGEGVHVASYFGVESWSDGEASFYGSAHFGITAPAGAAIATASGAGYLAAAAVPEPATALMMALGLVGLLAAGRRARN